LIDDLHVCSAAQRATKSDNFNAVVRIELGKASFDSPEITITGNITCIAMYFMINLFKFVPLLHSRRDRFAACFLGNVRHRRQAT
jgi:hypothetical protein